MKKLYKTFILLLLLPCLTFAGGIDLGKYSKQKSIKKAYLVNSDAGIDIKNSYGNVTVTTWDEDKVELDITIKVSGDNESWVDKRLEEITVDIEALKSMVSAETKIAKSGNNGSRNNSMEINYTIRIPKNGGVKINNSYGAIISSDLAAGTNLVCKYGRIQLGKLNGNTNVIRIDYCSKSTIESIKNATIDADYSGLSINDFNKISLSADYTDVKLGNGTDLKYACNYGKLSLGKLNNLDGDGDYLSVRIGEIAGNLKIDTNYSKIAVDELSAKFSNVAVISTYTSVDLNYNAATAFDFDVATRYANFKYDDLEVNSKHESGSTKTYEGYYRKSGENRISLKTSYGNISLLKK